MSIFNNKTREAFPNVCGSAIFCPTTSPFTIFRQLRNFSNIINIY